MELKSHKNQTLNLFAGGLRKKQIKQTPETINRNYLTRHDFCVRKEKAFWGAQRKKAGKVKAVSKKSITFVTES